MHLDVSDATLELHRGHLESHTKSETTVTHILLAEGTGT